MKLAKVVCLVGPSGVGKTSYILRLKNDFGYQFPLIFTTRCVRKDDPPNYRYVDIDTFMRMASLGSFIETDKYLNYYYGTRIDGVFDSNTNPCVRIILDLTPDGAIQVQRFFPSSVIVLLLPDSPKWLINRLEERGTNTTRDIKDRTECLEKYIISCSVLGIKPIYVKHHPSTWDMTYSEIVSAIGGEG